MAEYHVGIGFAGVIYAGTLTKDKKRWINKSDVTDVPTSADDTNVGGKKDGEQNDT